MEYEHGFTYREYLADAVVHAFGVIGAAVGAIPLILWALSEAPIEYSTPLMAYGAGLIASFTLSAAYNICLHKPARHLLRRLDHAAIYALIAGTYTPIALIGVGGTTGWVLTIAAWIVAAIGITLKLFFFFRFERFSFLLTLAQAWLAVLALGPVGASFNTPIWGLILGGGLVISLGVFFHLRDHWPFNRAIWHMHVLLGSAAHYIAVVTLAGLR